ncbi:MAG: hypothetical protein AB1726_04025 [Planctomycetota bacterium]
MNEEERAPETSVPPSPRAPHPAGELRALFGRPHRTLAVVLAEPERLASTIAAGRNVVLLVGALLYTSVVFALPFGAVLGLERFWRVALLFVGSLAICFPSLQVFSSYVGCRMGVRQNLALGLVITCVGGVFTFGFFPVLWFLQATMSAESSTITPRHIAVVLLFLSLLAGIMHLYRCLRRVEGLVRAYSVVITCWQLVFVFISYRMARLLDLL